MLAKESCGPSVTSYGHLSLFFLQQPTAAHPCSLHCWQVSSKFDHHCEEEEKNKKSNGKAYQ